MGWIKNGESVRAVYMGQPIEGRVEDSRVKYGGRVQYTVELTQPIQLRWRTEQTTRVLIEDRDLV